MVNSGTEDLLLHTIQYRRACAVNEEKKALHLVVYFSRIMYKYYPHIGFIQIKHNEEGEKPTMKYSTIYHIS